MGYNTLGVIMNNEDLLKLVQINHEDGKTKDQVCELLMNNGVKFSQIPKIIKESGIKFGRSRSGISISSRVIQIVVNDPSISVPDIMEQIEEFTTNPKYLATHIGNIVKETIELMNQE